MILPPEITRRKILGASLGCLGYSLADFMQLRGIASGLPETRTGGRAKSCIVLFTWGGMSHLDTWDTHKDNFNRPKINGGAGRDHFLNCYSIALAGGGIRGGQVYGASDSSGAEPAENGCTPADLHATIFEALGLPHKATITDRLGRPFPISDGSPLPLT